MASVASSGCRPTSSTTTSRRSARLARSRKAFTAPSKTLPDPFSSLREGDDDGGDNEGEDDSEEDSGEEDDEGNEEDGPEEQSGEEDDEGNEEEGSGGQSEKEEHEERVNKCARRSFASAPLHGSAIHSITPFSAPSPLRSSWSSFLSLSLRSS